MNNNTDYRSVRPVFDEDRPGLYIETYGCQMNVNDSEVILSILQKHGYSLREDMDRADVIIINTCAIRDNAEQRIWGRLDIFRQLRQRRRVIVGVVGCMAERLKEKLLEHIAVDFVAGPDAYRNLPGMIQACRTEGKQIDTLLSHEETYADISPVRMDKNGVSAFISIMRGCNNVCSYCVVPYTRGAERSRNPESIIAEARELIANGYKEINLLGQNVDSYLWKDKEGRSVNFAELLRMTAALSPQVRIRFSTSHPKDISDEVIETMASIDNICKHIHLPVQSGSSRILSLMRRKYDREWYLERIAKIRSVMPQCAITTDVIAGFCTETQEDHMETMSLMEQVGFDGAFMFQYSERPGTLASRKYKDDVPAEVKTKRLNEIIELQNRKSLESNRKEIGRRHIVLIEGESKRSKEELLGRTTSNKVCIFPANAHKTGEYVEVEVYDCTSATLLSRLV